MPQSEESAPQLGDGYSKARVSALAAAGLLLLVQFEKLDLSKPIPVLNISLPDPDVVKAVLCVVVAYNVFRMLLDWFQSDTERRHRVASRIDLVVSLLLAAAPVVLYLVGPVVIRFVTALSLVSVAALILFGFVSGHLVGCWMWLLPFVRGREEARRLALHRLPVAGRAILSLLPWWVLTTATIVALSRSFTYPLADIWLWLIAIPSLFGIFGSVFDLLKPFRRLRDGSRISRREYLARIRRNFAWHDSMYQVSGWDTWAPYQPSALFEACERGDLEAVQRLVTSGKPVNTSENRGWTPLMMAVAQQHVNVTRFLLQKGANPNVVNALGRSPLTFAARYGNEELVRLLLESGADPNIRESHFINPPLEAAAISGHKGIAELLLHAGADPFLRNHFGKSALDIAEEEGNGEIATLLRHLGKKCE